MWGMDRVVNDDVFVALATRPDLQSLKFQKTITAKLVSIARGRQNRNCGESHLFPQLRKLVCSIEVDGLFSLLPHLPRLTHLETTIPDSRVSSVEIHGSLSDVPIYCPNLQSLKSTYTSTKDINIPPDDLVKLAQGLQHLTAMRVSGYHLRAPGLETAHIAKIAEALPSLRVLGLAFPCALTETALVEVGKNCGRTLIECELWGSYNLSNLEEGGISFPLLEDLVLETVVSSMPDSTTGEAENNARLLIRAAPHLQSFDIMVEDSFANVVMDFVDEYIGV
jgi:hypothetical protein